MHCCIMQEWKQGVSFLECELLRLNCDVLLASPQHIQVLNCPTRHPCTPGPVRSPTGGAKPTRTPAQTQQHIKQIHHQLHCKCTVAWETQVSPSACAVVSSTQGASILDAGNSGRDATTVTPSLRYGISCTAELSTFSRRHDSTSDKQQQVTATPHFDRHDAI